MAISLNAQVPPDLLSGGGHAIVYLPDQPPPLITEEEGRFWLQTNAAGSWVSNGVAYRVIVVKTNYGARPADGGVRQMRHSDEDFAARMGKQKEEDKRLGINQELREREELLKKLGKKLYKGMPASDVVKLMGKPDQLEIENVVGVNQYVNTKDQVEQLAGHEANCTMVYSPYAKYSPYRRNGPYQSLEMLFDKAGKLKAWSWEY